MALGCLKIHFRLYEIRENACLFVAQVRHHTRSTTNKNQTYKSILSILKTLKHLRAQHGIVIWHVHSRSKNRTKNKSLKWWFFM